MNGVFDMKIFLVYKWALKGALADLKPDGFCPTPFPEGNVFF